MDANVLKPVVLTSIRVGTSVGLSLGITKAINRANPDVLDANLIEGSTKEQLVKAAKIIGVSIGIALVAGAVANLATNQIETIFWSNATFDNPQEG